MRPSRHRPDNDQSAVSHWTSVVSATLVFGGVTLFAFALLFISPWGQPVLQVQVESSHSGFSQAFFAQEENGFVESASAWAPVSTERTTVRFPLRSWRGTVGTFIRWDPLDQPARVTISRLALKSPVLHQEIDLAAISPSVGMSEVLIDGEEAVIELQSNDAQALLSADVPSFVRESLKRSAFIAVGIGLIAGAATVLLLSTRRRNLDFVTSSPLRSFIPVSNRPIPIPVWVLLSLSILSLAGLASIILGARSIGISWDEPSYESALGEFFRSGWYAPRSSFVDGSPSDVAAFVYGPFGDLAGHVIGSLLGTQPWFTESFTPASYEMRHLAVGFISLAGIASSALTMRVLTREWRWALVGLAVVVSVPLFMGHSMFNTKDAPVAAGFSILTLGLAHLVTQRVAVKPLLISALLMGVGIVVAVGSRPGIWIALVATALGTLILAFLSAWRSQGIAVSTAWLSRTATAVVIAVIGAYLVLWFIYPMAFSNISAMLSGSLSTSQAFPWSGQTLTAGNLMPAPPPWNYIPLWLGAQLPLIVLVGALLGLVGTLVSLIAAMRRRSPVATVTIGAIPVALQAVTVPLGAVLLGSTLYGGLRQLLFIFPAVAILATLGIYWTLTWLRSTRQRILLPVVWILVVIGLAVPLFSQIRLFPYSFAFFNAAAASTDIDRNWDVDGWWLSGRELVEGQQFPERTICVDSTARPITDCSRMGMITPYLEEFGTSDVTVAEDQYVALSRFPQQFGADQCAPFREVTRGLFFQEIVLSHADVCTVNLAPYPDVGMSFAGLAKEDPVVLWGWNPFLLWGWGQPDPQGVWLVDQEASVGFTLPFDGESAPQEITITGTGSEFGDGGATLRVFVNGVDVGQAQVPASGVTQTLTFRVPSGAWSELGDGRVIVRLEVEGVDLESLTSISDTDVTGIYRLEQLNVDV